MTAPSPSEDHSAGRWAEVVRRLAARRERDDAIRRADQIEALPKIGEVLREARLARGLNHADVERDIRINRLYLEALEAGHYDALPAPVYARGFMRSYARYLGVDPEEAVASIPRDLPRPAGLEPIPGLRRSAPAALPSIDLRSWGAVLGVALVVVGLVWFGPRLLGEGDGSTPPVEEPTSVATSSAAPPAVVATVPPFEPGETPNFLGVSREAAEATLRELGLVPFIAEAVSGTAAPGTVFSQSPQPGVPIEEGDTVTIFVSRGASGGQ